MAKTDYYLKLEAKGQTVKGESKANGHENEIQLSEFSWTEHQEGSGTIGSGSGTGKVKRGDLIVKMPINSASPELMRACAAGKPFDKATLTCRKAGGNQEDYLKVTMSKLIVTKYETVGKFTTVNGEETVLPYDEVRFGFTEIKFEYKPQNDDGTLGAAVSAGFNFETEGKV